MLDGAGLGLSDGLTAQESFCSVPPSLGCSQFDLIWRSYGTLLYIPNQQPSLATSLCGNAGPIPTGARGPEDEGHPWPRGIVYVSFGVSYLTSKLSAYLINWSLTMSGLSQPRRPINAGSILLTSQENDCLFNYLGRKCTVSIVLYFINKIDFWTIAC